MLQNIRDRLTGPLVWFVVGLIGIPFAFWGIGTFNFGGGDPVVVKVGDQDITQNRFQQAFNQRYQQYRALLGDGFRADLFDEGQFRRLTLDDMIQDSAMRQFAIEQGYRASDQSVRDLLLEIPAFQSDGKFSKDTYLQVLQRQGMTPESYESQLRQSLVIDQLRNAIQTSAFVTDEEVWQSYRLEKQTRSITAVPVTTKNFRDKAEVSDEQIAELYASDKKNYMSAERMKVRYIELDRNKLPEIEKPDSEVLKVLYDAEKDARFSSPEERKARHILIEFGDDKAQSRKLAEGLSEQARAGTDFSELASTHSSDPGSKEKGGDLGWVRKGVMVPEFEAALFAMESGKVSDPVESDFGWHVIRLDEVREPSVRAFEDEAVQAELLDVFRNRERETHFKELSDQLELLAFENTELEPVAEKLGLQVQTSDWFTRGEGQGIATIEAVRSAAFAPEVIQSGENSKPIAASADALVVVHKEEHEAARQLPLEEVIDELRERLVTEQARRLAGEAAASIVAEVKAGAKLTDIAQKRGLEVQFSGDAQRGQAELDAWVASAVFRMPRPDSGTVEVQALQSSEGGMTVVALTAVNDPERPAEADRALDSARDPVRDGVAGAEFAAYQQAVEDAVSVEMVNAPELEANKPEF